MHRRVKTNLRVAVPTACGRHYTLYNKHTHTNTNTHAHTVSLWGETD